MLLIDQALARRIEAAEAQDVYSMRGAMAALAGNPYGLTVRRFGQVVAVSCPARPEQRNVNRVIGGGAETLADTQAAIAWVRSHGTSCRVDVNPFDTSGPFLAFLAGEGFVTRRYTATLAGETAVLNQPWAPPPGVTVRRAETEADVAFAAESAPGIFEATGDYETQFRMDAVRATFRMPDWATYVARVDGEPAGFAQLLLTEGVGSLVIAGTLPQFKGRGVQAALIRQRIADAAAAGCDLVVTQTGLDSTTSRHNMLRAGFQLAYTKAEFTDQLPGKRAPQ